MRPRRALFVAFLALAFAACDKDPIVVGRAVNVHYPKACAPPSKVYGVYYAWGDFQPTTDRPAQSKLYLVPGASLSELPEDTRALVLDASDVASGDRWLAEGPVATSGDVDVLLWPSSRECALTGTTDVADGRLLGTTDDGHVLVTAGQGAGGSVPPTFVVDLARGTVKRAALGLLNARVNARIDPFPGGAIVTGGTSVDDDSNALANAEVFVSASNLFDRSKVISLSQERTEHASVALANGDVLLIGGKGAAGKSMDRIDASLGQASKEGLFQLANARRRPIAIRLGSGDIMVAGGLDAADQPVPPLEFFAGDTFKPRSSTATIPARPNMDCVATDGGGALCVIAAVSGDPADFATTWIVSADRGASRAQSRISAPLTDVRLMAGPDGRPVLWTGTTFLRWDPWAEEFTAELDGLGLDDQLRRPKVGQPLIAPSLGLLFWLDSDGSLLGRRFSVRSDYTADPLPYAVSTLSGLAPDRSPLGSAMGYSIADGLALPEGTSVFVADLRFRDFTLDVDLKNGDALGLVLRTGSGDVTCTLPGTAPTTIHVERRGPAVVARAGGTERACPAPPEGARVGVGLRGGAPADRVDRVRNVRISR